MTSKLAKEQRKEIALEKYREVQELVWKGFLKVQELALKKYDKVVELEYKKHLEKCRKIDKEKEE